MLDDVRESEKEGLEDLSIKTEEKKVVLDKGKKRLLTGLLACNLSNQLLYMNIVSFLP